jgi:hypothetical protein
MMFVDSDNHYHLCEDMDERLSHIVKEALS